jgi:ATP-dependent DNA helicase RecQ
MRKPKILVQGFDRPNIHLRVDSFKTEAEKRDALVHRVRWSDKPGIIYTGTRKAAEEIMHALAAEDIDALYYHGGLKAMDRHEIQERFMSGNAEVMVATNAFGMGVDKADIHFVYHYDAPDSLDSYYQEIGRAGRDGKNADAVLFYRREDIGAQSFKTSEGRVDVELMERVIEKVSEEDDPLDPNALAEEVGLSQRKLTNTLRRLQDAGAVETLVNGAVRAVDSADSAEAIQTAVQQDELHREAKKERLQKMREYAELSTCRREMILQYLGDSFQGPCGNCDNCEAATGQVREDPKIGTRREVV